MTDVNTNSLSSSIVSSAVDINSLPAKPETRAFCGLIDMLCENLKSAGAQHEALVKEATEVFEDHYLRELIKAEGGQEKKTHGNFSV